MSVVAVAEEAEEVDEEVDEVEVERQGAEGGEAAVGHRGIHLGHLAYLLSIPSGKAYEKEHSHAANNPVEGGAMGEDVHHHQDKQTEEGHVEIGAYLGERACGEIAVDAHRAKHSGGDEEGLGYRRHGVDHKYERQREAVDHREEEKQACGHARTHLLQTGRNPQHQADLNDGESPINPRIGGYLIEQALVGGSGRGHQPCGESGDEQPEKHLQVHAFHHCRHFIFQSNRVVAPGVVASPGVVVVVVH